MEVQFAVAKVGKYASSESGDTLEMIERPHGGLSLVLVDGQRSGKSAKAISNVVARKAIQLLSEGVRDGAAARAAHDYLFTYRGGKVSATLNILSVDTHSRTLVISRNNPAPVIVHTPERGLYVLDEPSEVVGVRRNVKPLITEVPLVRQTLAVAFTDGLPHAGSYSGMVRLEPLAVVQGLVEIGIFDPQRVVNLLLERAVELDQGRPRDDISVMAVAVLERTGDDARRLNGRVPL
ncbi:MAG: SpoIIE family protein phosphatase [Chloroflexi bacterium]|nr:SpoIIE family protein phosphatase [Chloroflexota bacterium]MCI0574653.1 SpoIIE family protein phosphatase [Chloroflexota bacterium]MCI0649065.1 SpoIIE family protein phosphatase [Chloroflexota bacterium]MCI0730520.1 SpoIIE family protein phosphatase [Chloroflexota bacterium]